MARPRAANYDDRRREILRSAAALFARQGYDRTSMAEIASALGVSKALFYHYYASKDALLFDIIQAHLGELVEVAAAADDSALAPRERLAGVVSAILECYQDADHEHQIQIGQLARLPEAQQRELKTLERLLVGRVAEIVGLINPRLPREQVKPIAMSLFGTLNWKYMWFREGGPMGGPDYAKMVTGLFADGIAALGDDAGVAKVKS